jgi:diguanylate cyclase (GGDEF)-like protein
MGQNRFLASSYKLAEQSQSRIHPVAATALRSRRSTQLRRASVPLFFDREKSRSCQHVLRQLLSEANQDFAGLLQDLHTTLSEHEERAPDRQINNLLMRAVRCATKQYLLQNTLGGLAFTDELTGLLNRRGFMAIAQHQLKVGRRSARGMILFFLDLDGLKHINDCYGHGEGDRALKRAARALEMTFRDSDVIARIGGDEFAVLAVEASRNSEAAMRSRLSRALKLTGEKDARYELNLSLGAARVEIGCKSSMRKLMDMADQSMYEQKQHRLKSVVPQTAKIRGRSQPILPIKNCCGGMIQ